MDYFIAAEQEKQGKTGMYWQVHAMRRLVGLYINV